MHENYSGWVTVIMCSGLVYRRSHGYCAKGEFVVYCAYGHGAG